MKKRQLIIFETPGKSIDCERLSDNILYDNMTTELIILYNVLLFKTGMCNVSTICNHKYGGFNASVLLIQPNINDFILLINILETNKNNKNLRLYYPEQQLLTLVYCILCPNIDDNFEVDTMQHYNNTNKDFQILIYRLASCANNCNIVNSICNNLDIDINIIQDYIQNNFITDINNFRSILFGTINIVSIQGYIKNKCWIVPVLNDNYYITEYYTTYKMRYLNNDPSIMGYPILQQNKLWNIIQSIIDNGDLSLVVSFGDYEWFLTYYQMYKDNVDFFDTFQDINLHSDIINILIVHDQIVGKKDAIYKIRFE